MAWLAGCALLAFLVGFGAPARALEPLKVENKTNLFQRVLTRPGAQLRAEPDGEPVDGSQPRAFDTYYVFARRDGWAQVGAAFAGPALGWIDETQTVDWQQTIVVAFSNPAGRPRSLFFDDRQAIEDILNAEDYVAQLAALREQAIDGTLPADSPVISIEPENDIDIEENFYLLPILEHTSILNPLSYEDMQILKVAAIPQGAVATPAAAPSEDEALQDFKIGVMFVIDTTSSMLPYIEATREAVNSVLARLQATDYADRVSFGLVGFRDSTDLVPELDYVYRSFVDLEPNQDPGVIAAQLDSVEEADVSSPGFNEDVYAGYESILEEEIWKPFAARFVIVITDAGPKLDDQSTLGEIANSQTLGRRAADELGIGTYVLHLRTDAGASTHNHAQNQYTELARPVGSDSEARYYPIAGGSQEAFAQVVETVTRQIDGAIVALIGDRLEDAIADAQSDVERALLLDTLAMKLAFLGERQGEQAPAVFESWISHRVLEDTSKNALDVRLLISRDQLSTLNRVLKSVVDAAGGSDTDSSAFFERLQSALAAMTRDPRLVVNAEFDSLGEALGEFLEGLPYRSELLEMTQERWLNISSSEQHALMRRLQIKVRNFERIHDNPDLWTALHEDAPPGEAVYPLLLELLP